MRKFLLNYPIEPAMIVEVKEGPEYYVHFEGLDKRLDRWVVAQDLQPQQILETPAPGRTRHSRRQLEAINPTNQVFNDSNPDVKALEQRHQEITKVRNIEKLYFGDYQIDTWYYSPYPDEYG